MAGQTVGRLIGDHCICTQTTNDAAVFFLLQSSRDSGQSVEGPHREPLVLRQDVRAEHRAIVP